MSNLPAGFDYVTPETPRGTVTVRPNVPANNGLPEGFSYVPPSTTQDVLSTIPAALARGAAYVAGFPGDVEQLLNTGAQWAERKIRGETDEQYQQRLQTNQAFAQPAPESLRWKTSAERIQQIEDLTGPLYKPQTRTGEYINTIGEFLPGAMLGPGSLARNAIAFGILPGAANELAGGLTKDSQAEPWARTGATVGTAVAAALATRPSHLARTVSHTMEQVSPRQMQVAEALMQDAQAAGVPLSWPEAIQHVTNGATSLGDLQRVVEGSGRMREFYSHRPQQVQTAGAQQIDRISPPRIPTPSANPTMIGPNIGETAENIVSDVRGAINRHTDPLYTSAGQNIVPAQPMARVRNLPGYEDAAAAIRNDPQLARYVEGMPENSVAYLNEMKKYFGQEAQNAAQVTNPRANQQRAAGFGRDEQTVRQIAIDASGGQTGEYAQALAAQQQLRAQYLEPLLNGPLGQLAKRDQSTKAAIDALFPANPVANADEITTTVRALAARNPQAARDLVGAHIRSVFAEQTQNLATGPNPQGGAKFAAVIRGNPQQAANLEAAIRALPNGEQIYPGFDRFLEILEASGRRPAPNSATAFNLEAQNNLRKGGLISEGATMAAGVGLQWPKRIKDGVENWRLGQNLEQLARLFVDPEAGRILQRLVNVPSGSAQAAFLAGRLVSIAQREQPSARNN